MIQLLQLRPLGLRDTSIARLLGPFYDAGLVHLVREEEEEKLIEDILQTHPAHKRGLEHVLIDLPEADHLPSALRAHLLLRDDHVPTFLVQETYQGQLHQIYRLEDYAQLMELLQGAITEGQITDACDKTGREMSGRTPKSRTLFVEARKDG